MDMNIKSEQAEGTAIADGDYDRSPTIYLNDDQCEALGIKGLPEPGSQFTLRVIATVVRASVSAEEQGEKGEEGNKTDLDLSLRLGDIEIVQRPPKTAADTLYGAQS